MCCTLVLVGINEFFSVKSENKSANWKKNCALLTPLKSDNLFFLTIFQSRASYGEYLNKIINIV